MNKEKIKDFILKNCIINNNVIDLSDLDFSGYRIILTNIKADYIYNDSQKAKYSIYNTHQTAKVGIYNHLQDGGIFIENDNQISNTISNIRQVCIKRHD